MAGGSTSRQGPGEAHGGPEGGVGARRTRDLCRREDGRSGNGETEVGHYGNTEASKGVQGERDTWGGTRRATEFRPERDFVLQ